MSARGGSASSVGGVVTVVTVVAAGIGAAPAFASSAEISAGRSDTASAFACACAFSTGANRPCAALSKRDAPSMPLVRPRNRPSAPSLTIFWIGFVCGISSRVRSSSRLWWAMSGKWWMRLAGWWYAGSLNALSTLSTGPSSTSARSFLASGAPGDGEPTAARAASVGDWSVTGR